MSKINSFPKSQSQNQSIDVTWNGSQVPRNRQALSVCEFGSKNSILMTGPAGYPEAAYLCHGQPQKRLNK